MLIKFAVEKANISIFYIKGRSQKANSKKKQKKNESEEKKNRKVKSGTGITLINFITSF